MGITVVALKATHKPRTMTLPTAQLTHLFNITASIKKHEQQEESTNMFKADVYLYL